MDLSRRMQHVLEALLLVSINVHVAGAIPETRRGMTAEEVDVGLPC